MSALSANIPAMIGSVSRHEALSDLAARELAGETLLWGGQPDVRRSFLRVLPIWLFALPWTVLSLIWEYVSVAGMLFEGFRGTPSGLAWFFTLFGLPFLLVGFGMLGYPFWVARRARRCLHALTNARLVTLIAGRKPEIRSHDPSHIVSLVRRDLGGGNGDLEIGFGSVRDSDGDSVELKESWIGVPDATGLETLLIGRAAPSVKAAQ